ncbi:hypothetical protein D3C72_1333850 [compost metagenome]
MLKRVLNVASCLIFEISLRIIVNKASIIATPVRYEIGISKSWCTPKVSDKNFKFIICKSLKIIAYLVSITKNKKNTLKKLITSKKWFILYLSHNNRHFFRSYTVFHLQALSIGSLASNIPGFVIRILS